MRCRKALKPPPHTHPQTSTYASKEYTSTSSVLHTQQTSHHHPTRIRSNTAPCACLYTPVRTTSSTSRRRCAVGHVEFVSASERRTAARAATSAGLLDRHETLPGLAPLTTTTTPSPPRSLTQLASPHAYIYNDRTHSQSFRVVWLLAVAAELGVTLCRVLHSLVVLIPFLPFSSSRRPCCFLDNLAELQDEVRTLLPAP